jgi:hypothetical protein
MDDLLCQCNSDKKVLCIVIIVVIVINKWAYIRGWAYIWNEVSVSTCGGLIHGGAYIRQGL